MLQPGADGTTIRLHSSSVTSNSQLGCMGWTPPNGHQRGPPQATYRPPQGAAPAVVAQIFRFRETFGRSSGAGLEKNARSVENGTGPCTRDDASSELRDAPKVPQLRNKAMVLAQRFPLRWETGAQEVMTLADLPEVRRCAPRCFSGEGAPATELRRPWKVP